MVPFGRGAVGGFSALWRSLGLLQEPVRPGPSCLSPVLPLTHSLHQRGFVEMDVLQVSVRSFSFSLSLRSLSGWYADLSALLQRCCDRVVGTASAGGLGVAL